MLSVLARYPVIFSSMTLAAWRRSEMTLLVLILLATGRVLALLYLLLEGESNLFYFLKHITKLVSSTTESKLQRVHAYVGHPVF